MGAAAVGLSAGLTTLAVGGTAGSLTAGTTITGNYILGQPTDARQVGVESAIAALTAGTLKFMPKVRGRLPVPGGVAFFFGAHAQREGAEALLDAGTRAAGQSAYRYAASGGNGSPLIPRAPAQMGTGSGGYGSPGTVYTSFVPPTAHSACGSLCR